MNIKILAAAVTTLALTAFPALSATTVSSFSSGYWSKTDMRGNGEASLVDLTGAGGNLEANVPLGTGAAKLQTGLSNNDKAQVGMFGAFGTVGDFLNGGRISYDYYNEPGNSNQAAAPSFKMIVVNPANPLGTPTQFVYEPYWNINPGVSTNPTPGVWTSQTITGGSGLLWHTGFAGDGNQAGGGNLGKTMGDWGTHFGLDLTDALIIGFAMGIGTYNQGVTAYFDNLSINTGNFADTFDFEVSVVPLPAALPLYGAGVAALGLMGWRRKRKQQAA